MTQSQPVNESVNSGDGMESDRTPVRPDAFLHPDDVWLGDHIGWVSKQFAAEYPMIAFSLVWGK